MLPQWCVGCHQPMPGRTSTGYCHDCNRNQPPVKRSLLGKLFLWACLIGAAVAIAVVWLS